MLEKNIFNHSKENFNLASPKQLGEVLFEKLKIIEKPKKTKKSPLTGGVSKVGFIVFFWVFFRAVFLCQPFTELIYMLATVAKKFT